MGSSDSLGRSSSRGLCRRFSLPGRSLIAFLRTGQISSIRINRSSARQDGDVTEIKVRDNGHGMNEETLQHLFEPFYSTKGDLGNGLGLYISHEIVERNAGTLTVTSKPGTGTEVRVRLPATAPPSAKETALESSSLQS